MDAANYNRYLAAIKFANDLDDKDRAKELLRKIQEEMILNYGLSDSDVEYLIRQFRYYI